MDLESMAERATGERARLVFLCRPNNPTGGVFGRDALDVMLQRLPPETLVVLDEAYTEFDTTSFDSRAILLDRPNLIVTRTFSKLYGLAGLRLGYGIMRPEILAPMLRVRDPFSVNTVAAAAGIAALEDQEHRELTLDLVREGKHFLYAAFERLGLSYVPTEANFILVRTRRSAVELSNDLLHRGVLVRPCTSFGLPNSIRITIGTPAQNDILIRALEAIFTP